MGLSEAELESLQLHGTLYHNASRLDAIFQYAANPYKNTMPEIPDLPDEAASFLSTWRGTAAVASWALAASDARHAINTLVGITLSSGADLLEDLPAVLKTIEAEDIVLSSLRDRLTVLAETSQQ